MKKLKEITIQKILSKIIYEFLIFFNRILYDLFEELEKMGNYKNNARFINESIQILEEYLLFGENKESNIHELFCQYNFIGKLLIFSNSKVKDINLQLLKTFSKLINNITDEMLFYYLMSNNFINNIISKNNFFKYDNNYLEIYINFLKILSSKLNKINLQFLFLEEINSFPLLENAIKFYNHPNIKIRGIIKSIFLKVLSIEYKPLYKYLCNLPIISYFCFLSCNIKDEIISLSKEIIEIKKKKKSSENFKLILNDIIDNLIYIQNIFDENILKINFILINCLFYYCIIPYVLNNINLSKTDEKNENTNYKIKKSVSLFFINLLLKYIKNETLLNILFTLIFFPYKTNSINKYFFKIPIQPSNYYFDWNKSIRRASTSFFEYIQYNLNKLFLKSILFMNNSKYIQIQEIYLKYQNKLNYEPNFDFKKNKEKFLKEITKDILDKLPCSEICIMSSYHNNLSISTGMNCGLSTKSSKACIIQKMKNLYSKYFNKNNEDIEYKLIKNNIKNHLFEYLDNKNGKQNDKKILLINILLKNILNKNKNISRILYKESNIIPGDMLKDEEISYIFNFNKDKFFTETKQIELINKKKNLYNNYSIKDKNFIIENADSKINLEKEKNNIIENYENKENLNNINAQYFETDIFKNSKISNTLISINDFINNTNNTITLKSKKSSKNLDNNEEEELDAVNNKESKDEFIIQKNSFEGILPKDKYSPLDSKYFNDIENNLNIFSSENNKMSYEVYYNEELVNKLIKLLDINSNIKIITFKIIIDNILSLITTNRTNNFIKNNIINQCFISKTDKNKIYLIYEKYRTEIISNYNNKKSFHNNAYKLFIKQYDKYLFLNKFDYDSIIKEGYILIDDNINISNKSNLFLSFEKNENENKYEKNIILFFLMHDLFYKISSLDNYHNNKTGYKILADNLYINNFPLLKRKGLELNKKYYLLDIDSNIKYYYCRCKFDKNRNKEDKEFSYCYLLIYDNFLYIGDSSNNSSYTIIKYKFLISSCSIISDNYNNKNMIINIANDTIKENNIEILLDFKDYNTSKSIKQIIDIEMKNSILYEKGKIKEFIEHLK